MKVEQTVQKTTYQLDAASGQLIAVVRDVIEVTEVATGQNAWRLKAGARLDAETGVFYRKKTAEEVEIEPYVVKDPPAWIMERMQAHGRI